MSAPPDLEALFANLQPRVSRGSAGLGATGIAQSESSTQAIRNQTIPSTKPTASPPVSLTSSGAPHLPRSSMSSPFQGTGSGNNERSQSLLNLLRFSQPENSSASQRPEAPARSTSASTFPPSNPLRQDPSVLAPKRASPTLSFPGDEQYDRGPADLASLEGRYGAAIGRKPSPSNPQEALLRLLNRSISGTDQASHGRSSNTVVSSIENQSPAVEYILPEQPSPAIKAETREQSPMRMFGSRASQETTPFEPPKLEDPPLQKENKTIFTYTNPFEALNVARDKSISGSKSHSRPASPAVELMSKPEPTKSTNAFEQGPTNNNPGLDVSAKESPLQIEPSIMIPRTSIAIPEPARQSSKSLESEAVAIKDVEKSLTQEKPNVFREELKAGDGIPDNLPIRPKYDWDGAEASQQDVTGAKGVGPETDPSKDKERNGADLWESADDSPAKEEPQRVVPVYNFPVKVFMSWTLVPGPRSEVGLRDDGIMDISRFKKDFDQLDRSLAAATSKYITYALVKNGGMRVIRQDDGSDRQVFKNSRDRIFNVAICTTAVHAAPTDHQAVLGVGVSGAVYYATISREGHDLFEDGALESESLVFPPYPLGDENNSGGVLKTRAKKSSRHPEFFAIGRGKSINIIWPATGLSARYGVNGDSHKVDIEKFYKDRTLCITTGKAGKDFAFSEDDSLIVSLDKAGRLRFWDIRTLVDESNAKATKSPPIEVQIPLLTISTVSSTEKPWPTSVLFVDKLRPYTKATALRYLLVGMKQNHTLQLWDIALGKAVQEINFPHETERDGICSVSYHPNSGIIVVGHPTRNSIYFVHLSAPKYLLPPMSQATYIERLAIKDPDLPRPDSTACLSGIREISFATKGNLRSVELLPIHKATETAKDSTEVPPLFELYVVHSKGVTCLNIRKEDLGWSFDGKILHPVSALEEGLIISKELRIGTIIDESAEPSGQAEDEIPQAAKPSKDRLLKRSIETRELSDVSTGTPRINGKAPTSRDVNAENGVDSKEPASETPAKKDSKSKKKRQGPEPTLFGESPSRTLSPSKDTLNTKAAPTDEQSQGKHVDTMTSQPSSVTRPAGPPISGEGERVSVGISGDWLDKELKKIEKAVGGEFRKELNTLYQHIQNDRNVQDSAAVARQEAVLRLVSTTLSTNVENSLGRIIASQIQQQIVPAITSVTVQAVSSQVGEALARILHQLIPHELANQMPVAITATLQNPQITRILSETISQRVTAHVERHISDVLRTTITPSFQALAQSAAENATLELEDRVQTQLQQLEIERQHDSDKIDRLDAVLQGIAENLQALSASHLEFQAQILKDRRQSSQTVTSRSASTSEHRPTSTVRPLPVQSPSPAPHTKTEQEVEIEEISVLMQGGKFEEGSIRWLQSSQTIELFDKLFVRYTPEYLATDVSPLVAFSIGVTVGNSLATNTPRRLEWITAAFGAVDLGDTEIAALYEHAPTLLESLIRRLEALYMQILTANSNDPALHLIVPLIHKSKEMRATLSTQFHGHAH